MLEILNLRVELQLVIKLYRMMGVATLGANLMMIMMMHEGGLSVLSLCLKDTILIFYFFIVFNTLNSVWFARFSLSWLACEPSSMLVFM